MGDMAGATEWLRNGSRHSDHAPGVPFVGHGEAV